MGAGGRVRRPPNPLRPARYRKSIRSRMGAGGRVRRPPNPLRPAGCRCRIRAGGYVGLCARRGPIGVRAAEIRTALPAFLRKDPFAFPLPCAGCRAGANLRGHVQLRECSVDRRYGERRVAPRRFLSPEPLSFRPVETPGSGGKSGPGGTGGRTGTTLRGNVDLPGKAKGGRNLSRPAGDAVRTPGHLPESEKRYRSRTGKPVFVAPIRNHSLSSHCFFIPQVLITVYYKNSMTPCTPTPHPVKVPENITIYQKRI